MIKKFALFVFAFTLLFASANAEMRSFESENQIDPLPAARFGGVTNIKEVVNNTPYAVIVRKVKIGQVKTGKEAAKKGVVEVLETTRTIPKDGGVWSGDMWIPWVDNEQDFENSHIELSFAETRTQGRFVVNEAWRIWQNGEAVRLNNESKDWFTYVANAPKIPGESKSGGERRLIISGERDGKVSLQFEKF